ncbi:DUF305 domain-containing protein [Streptomyces sp. JH34]|uniref:DUF305 domain-containing protein n=1 Tax=Streptomyces sp. JH34 TaxID=2793633 RepID=UPI0023FA3B90|nr:DUF305 domain-containing protein [Streptomyces sp. JH34]MDF6022643.1 DUF305 domain-containing protein [Streptomyces sp. JH34]
MPRRTAQVRSAALAATLVAAVVALSGCDGGGGGTKAGADEGPSIVAPGKPGEPARTLSAEEAVKAAGDDTPNSADFRYARMMIEHHEQALVLTGLVPGRAASSSVERLAERISASQKPEIGAMEGWLKNNGGDGREETHDHSAMPGMATDEQIEQLRAAHGKAFDRMFLELMITHHQGAVTMATEALADGNNVLVEEMANDVVAQQTVEIDRMRGLMT